MPRLLPPGALDAPSTKARWAALAALSLCALAAWPPAWTGIYDTTRGLIPSTGRSYTWDALEVAAEPFQKDTATPLAGWSRYNAATTAAQPMRTAVVVDVRSCDTTADHCTADREIDERSFNNGPGGDWLDALLGIDCVHAIGGPCPGIGPDD